MSETDHSNPTPRLKASEALLLEYLREHADGEGCASYTRAELAAALGMAPSTMQLAVTGLCAHGYLLVERTPGGRPNVFCVTPTGPTDSTDRSLTGPTDSGLTGPTDGPTDSLSPDTPAYAHEPERAPAQNPLPTPLEPEAATRSGDPLARAGGPTGPTDDRPTDEDRPIPIGQSAVAAAIDAATLAGRAVAPSLFGRIGSTAQALAADGIDPAVILVAAQRLGTAGTTDLRSAVEAVQRGARLPAQVPVVADGARTASCIALLLGTWPRAQIDAALWEAELGKIQERFLLAAVRAIAREGGEFAPQWGKVWKVAHELGRPVVAAERAERARLAERARIEGLVS